VQYGSDSKCVLTLERFEKKEPFFIYTGRGPSSTMMHLGHMVPFELTKWISDVFQAPVVIMLTDGTTGYHDFTTPRIADVA
jgi:tryptophanyl-tRNA synthetase